jgi:hypothetical protein
MGYALVALLFTLIEVGLAVYGYYYDSSKTLYHLFVYGSPVHLVIHLFNDASVLQENNAGIIALALFHFIKYLFFYKAQAAEERHWTFYPALLLEIAYLAYSGYIIY